ncbi:metallophosphoesterase [Verrucomicrobiaceae bacterium 227]
MKRRKFAQVSSMALGAGMFSGRAMADEAGAKPLLRLGLLTDVHYADRETRGSRFYRDSLTKGKEAAAFFQEKKPAAVICLGDVIDAAKTVEEETSYLKSIAKVLDEAGVPRHHVLGNHCVATLTKEEFFEHSGQAVKKGYYSVDLKGVHVVILDACFNKKMEAYGRDNFQWTDANIPPAEMEWLKADLAGTELPVVVFAHQRLDLEPKDHHAVKQSPEVRRIFEMSGKVKAVFQGHSHKNELHEVAGIPYCTLKAMVEGGGVENSGYSLLEVFADGSLKLKGFRKQVDRELGKR